jgi:hypothetical protein
LVTNIAARPGKPLPPRGYLIKVRAVPPARVIFFGCYAAIIRLQ